MPVTLYTPLTGVGSDSWNDAYLNGLAAGLPSPRALPAWRAEVRLATTTRSAQASNVACLLPGRGPEARRAILVPPTTIIWASECRTRKAIPSTTDSRTTPPASPWRSGSAKPSSASARGRGSSRRGLDHSRSDYFVTHPLWPLDRMLGVVNLDANAPPAPSRSWRIAGADGSALVELVRQEAAREGVPAVFFVPGDGPYEGLSVTTRDERFPFEGLARYADFAIEVIRRMDAYRGSSGVSRTGPGGSR